MVYYISTKAFFIYMQYYDYTEFKRGQDFSFACDNSRYPSTIYEPYQQQ